LIKLLEKKYFNNIKKVSTKTSRILFIVVNIAIVIIIEFHNQLKKKSTTFFALPSNVTIIIVDGLSRNEIIQIKTRGNTGKVYSRVITSWCWS